MYFKKFPKIVYSDYIITDFTIRAKIVDRIKNSLGTYTPYIIKDGETPESLAQDYYGDPNHNWIIYLMNDIINPLEHWPMNVEELKQYTNDKYTDISDIHHYEDINGNLVLENTSGAIPVTNSTYEDQNNESKREILILKPKFLSNIVVEFNKIIANR